MRETASISIARRSAAAPARDVTRGAALLELRSTTGVRVLACARGDTVLPVDPGAPLAQGDVLVAVGTREQFLKARLLG